MGDHVAHAQAEGVIPELPGLTDYVPRTREVALKLPAGVDARVCSLVVDPQGAIDEINEQNNAYPLSRGVPPPVESAPRKDD